MVPLKLAFLKQAGLATMENGKVAILASFRFKVIAFAFTALPLIVAETGR